MQIKLKMVLLSSLMATLTAVGAFIRVPMVPVPVTLQTFFVLLAGGLLGSVWGCISMIIYLAMGFAGLPVFAGGGGIGILLSPTFGYLAAFPVSAFFVGKRFERLNSINHSVNDKIIYFLHLISGLLIIYVMGISYLWLIKNLYIGEEISLTTAVTVGFVIFIPGLLLKSILAFVIIFRLKEQLVSD